LADLTEGEAEVGIEEINSLIRFYYKIDPDTLTDLEWAMKYRDLCFIKQWEIHQMRPMLLDMIGLLFKGSTGM